MKKIKYILGLALLTMLLHTVEEYLTELYDVDLFITSASRYLSIYPIVLFFLIQILVLSLLGLLLWQSLYRRPNKILAVVAGLILLFEFIHVYDAINVAGYYPGLYTGVVLAGLSIFYWKELIKKYKLIL